MTAPTDNTSEEIENILMWVAGQGRLNKVRPALEGIQAYISKRVEEAKIDELRRLLMIGGVNIEVNDYCEQRLAQLTEGSKD